MEKEKRHCREADIGGCSWDGNGGKKAQGDADVSQRGNENNQASREKKKESAVDEQGGFRRGVGC